MRLKTRLPAVVLAALALAGSRAAHADCESVPGHPRTLVAESAVLTNNQLYGAVATLQNGLLPRLARAADGAWHLRFDQNAIYNVLSVPAVGCDDGTTARSLDLAAFSWGLGHRRDPVTLYYSVGLTGATFNPWGAFGRWVFPPLLGYVGLGYSLLAPVTGAAVYEKRSFTVAFDFVAGADVDLRDRGWLSLGYVGSRGVYADLRSKRGGLFSRAAVSESFEEVALVSGGFSSLDWLVGPAVARVGSTALYGRLIQWVAPPEAGADVEEVDRGELARVNGVSAHLEQWNIAGYVDVVAAVRLTPEIALQTFTVAVHDPAFAASGAGYGAARDRGARPVVAAGRRTWRATAGVFRAPDLAFYGVEGGYRLQASFSIRDELWEMIFAYNGTEVLDNFPYASNAFQIKVRMDADW